uniref:Chorein N-terminal domain-containing protein n=1 Tax=Electrophorus electricus TaxID=8005 RepID=A0A4W4FEN9_ELEEL
PAVCSCVPRSLCRFTKNLSPDKINLSTLKGEGQLSNLELDEEVLQNMLDLPTWLAVARVYCNKAAIRVSWGALMGHCRLNQSGFLDKVEVEMRTCDEPRPPNGPSPIAITAGQSEYGFAERVVEGMSVVINSIVIKVQARAFRASFELWQLQGCSLNPKWQKTDLRYTRITHPKRGEVLTFKEINWQSLRIEADAMESEDQDLGSTPLRLITNQGRIRIALKRRVKDCNVLASKLLFILDDLLWVLTDSQLKAVIHYAESLSEAMERSAQQRKSTAAETLQVGHAPPKHLALPAKAVSITLAQYFDLHDVKESSYHTFISRLDLHVCNDGPPVQSGPCTVPFPLNILHVPVTFALPPTDEPPIPGSQGAMQLTFRKLGCDYYPFHRPGEFRVTGEFTAEKPVRRTEPTVFDLCVCAHLFACVCLGVSGHVLVFSILTNKNSLLPSQVSTGERTSKPKQSLLSCNRKSLNLPDNTPAIHLQFTEYYYPSCPGVPVPCSNLYGQLNGLQLFADVPSLVWMAVFSRGLLQTLEQVKAFYHLQDSSRSEEHVDVRVDATHLKLIVPLDSSILDHPDRPQLLCAALPQAVLSNTRHSPHGSYGDLRDTCSSFGARPFFRAASARGFPCEPNVFHPLPPAFLRAAALDEPQAFSRPPRARDVWGVSLSRVALGFEGPRRAPRGRVLPFMEPFTAAVWMCRPAAFPLGPSPPPGPASLSPAFPGQEEGPECPAADVHVLAQAVTPVRVWLNHYQYLALLRVKDSLSRLAADLGRDTRDPHGRNPKLAEPPTACVSVLLEVLQVGLLLPPATEEEPKEEAVSREGSDSQSLTDSEEPAQGREEDGEGEVSVEEACEALEEGPAEQTGRVATSAASPPPSTPLMGGACRQPLKHSTSQNSCDSATLESSIADDGCDLYVTLLVRCTLTIFSASVSGCRLTRPSLSQVSVLLLSVGGVSSVVELHGEDVVMATEAQSLTMKQLGNQKMSAASSSHAAPPSPGPRSLCCPPVVALRMELGPGAGRHCAAAEGAGFLEACVRGCRAELSTSALNTLGPFLEDELSADAQPLRLSMHDTRLTLKDDGPRVYPTAPQPTPASFFLDGVVLERLDDGVLTLRCGSHRVKSHVSHLASHNTVYCLAHVTGLILKSICKNL